MKEAGWELAWQVPAHHRTQILVKPGKRSAAQWWDGRETELAPWICNLLWKTLIGTSGLMMGHKFRRCIKSPKYWVSQKFHLGFSIRSYGTFWSPIYMGKYWNFQPLWISYSLPPIPPVTGRVWGQTGRESYLMTFLSTPKFTSHEPPTTSRMSEEGCGTYYFLRKQDVFMDKLFFNVLIPKGHKLTEYLEVYENKNEQLLQIELLTL